MLEAVVLVLSVLLFSSFVVMVKFWDKIEKLNSEISKLKADVKKVEEVTSIEPGDKALIPGYGLSHKTTNENFTVDYEVEVLEVSTNQVKVKALSYTSHDSFARDPQNKQSIIDFLQNTWVPKKDIQLIVDNQIRRENKLNQLGI